MRLAVIATIMGLPCNCCYFPIETPTGFQWERETWVSSTGFLCLGGHQEVSSEPLKLWLLASVFGGVKYWWLGLEMWHRRLDLESHFAGALMTGSYQPATLIWLLTLPAAETERERWEVAIDRQSIGAEVLSSAQRRQHIHLLIAACKSQRGCSGRWVLAQLLVVLSDPC